MRIHFRLITLGFILLSGLNTFGQKDKLAEFNVVWDSPSKNSAGSMPIGNGDIGTNLWVEENGDLVFYISKTDAWDENDRLCKIGKVRVTFDPALSVNESYRQTLDLKKGTISIETILKGQPATIRFWVDANNPVVRFEVEAKKPVRCQAKVELWRTEERPFGKDDDSHSGSGLNTSDFKPTILADQVVKSSNSQVTWFHRNTRSIFNLALSTQNLGSLKDQFADPLLNGTFGANLSGKGFIKQDDLTLRSIQPVKHQAFSITVLKTKSTADEWLTQLNQIAKKDTQKNLNATRKAHESWWKNFWQRSWIFVDGAPEAQIVTQGYVLQRFMNASSGRGGAPIKFNGSIFTVEPKPGDSPTVGNVDPDWRRWGSNYWFQNTRLAYWPMLAAGDFEMMEPWFKMYTDALPLSRARVKTYYGFENAAQFPETMYFWGLPNNADYGWSNKASEPANSYISRYWNGSLELIAVMLDKYDYTGDEKFVQNTLLPLADPLIAFLDNYWQKRDAKGKIIFDPSQSLETWHVAVNPLPEIAGFKFLLPRLLALPKNLTTEAQRSRWTRILQELPPVPIAEVKGALNLRPAEKFAKESNSENTELYAVFPYRLYGVGQPDLAMAQSTFENRKNHHNKGWCQDGIQAACLGLRDEAAKLVYGRAARLNADARFPAMWGPNFDWVPDQDHGNNILTNLQFMVSQSVNDKIYLLPAWPKNWNVSFKLHAPKQTTIEGEYRDGKLSNLKVTPKSRLKDVVNMLPK
ncbi:MAG: DUF5703 domain-containing protein [Mariniphaga sp.]